MSKTCPKVLIDADAALRLLEESWSYFGKASPRLQRPVTVQAAR
jgi:hypothetical protein